MICALRPTFMKSTLGGSKQDASILYGTAQLQTHRREEEREDIFHLLRPCSIAIFLARNCPAHTCMEPLAVWCFQLFQLFLGSDKILYE